MRGLVNERNAQMKIREKKKINNDIKKKNKHISNPIES